MNNFKPRKGKTAKDHASGAHSRRLSNQRARGEWSNDRKDKISNPSGTVFPIHTCNGKKNQTRYTGPCNETVFTNIK
jgi:hypothetical protein